MEQPRSGGGIGVTFEPHEVTKIEKMGLGNKRTMVCFQHLMCERQHQQRLKKNGW